MKLNEFCYFISTTMKYQLFKNSSKNNRWIVFVISEGFVWNWIDLFTTRVECCISFWICMNTTFFGISRFSQFSPYRQIWSKISSNQKSFFIALSLYPLYFSRTLPLMKILLETLLLIYWIKFFNNILRDASPQIK